MNEWVNEWITKFISRRRIPRVKFMHAFSVSQSHFDSIALANHGRGQLFHFLLCENWECSSPDNDWLDDVLCVVMHDGPVSVMLVQQLCKYFSHNQRFNYYLVYDQ